MSLKYVKKRKLERDDDPFVIQNGKFKDGKMGGEYRSGWSEDVYILNNQEKETIGKNFNFTKIPITSFILLILLLVLLGKTAYLQVVKGDYYYSMAEGNRIRIERIEPKRGVIYDRNGKLLVRNKANFLIYFIPADLPEDDQEIRVIINRVAEIIGGITVEQIEEILSEVDRDTLEAYQPLFIADNIEYEKAMKLYLESASWPGVIISTKTKREYLYTGISVEGDNDEEKTFLSSSHILGYTGKINENELEKFGDEYRLIDYIGKMGIEYFWENELKGESGKKQVEVDALGKEKKIIGQVDAEAGHNLVLTLDIEQQLKLEDILLRNLKEKGFKKASAIIMDPKTGGILAMVSLPSYDNNVFARGITQEEYEKLINQPDKPLFNRSISGEYPSGSTIKPVMSAAALEEGVITEHTSFVSTGGIRIGQWFFPDWLAGGHGVVDVRRAIAESVNTFFYYIGGGYEEFRGLGVDRIIEYEELFGLGKQTGIDLAGEATGFLPTREWKEKTRGEAWYIGDTYHLSIGQGDLLVTPLQVAVFTSVFANEGKLYRPHFIYKVLSGDDKIIKDSVDEPVRENFIDPYNIKIVRQGMRQTVTAGSARRLQSVPETVAGKTGTAQWSTKNNNHAWFTGFAPYENSEIVITLLVEEGGEGSEVAVPIAEEYLKWYFGEYKKNKE